MGGGTEGGREIYFGMAAVVVFVNFFYFLAVALR